MSEINKTYRIRTNVGNSLNDDYITIDANLVQDYDVFDILSIKIDSVDTYKLHNANYGVVVGRVLANNGFGVPNAKISIFIPSDGEDGEKVRELYPFSSSASKNRKGVRYNLLPDNKVGDCHQIVGTFPNKRYALDNDAILEVFDKYYKYTTRTNNSGDYIIMGVPVGTHTLHMDLDLSDCGILSQRPRDFVYKGYTVEQFENPNMFKEGTNYSNLSQIFTQDQVLTVHPFWGNSSLGDKIGITRADIDIAFKFEPTCVFMGSVISDNSSQGISKKCIATENMGNMEELTTGEGKIEMIRKTPSGDIEEFQVKGTQLINGDGIWCYQIPMNLDYMMTDEYGNMVPTDNPDKGIPTRTRVRFRVSMGDNEENIDNYFRAKMLVPHNPQMLDGGKHEEYDYEFGSLTREDSFRDLFWNNVYSVKSYIPRFQKRKAGGWKEKKFTGIKNCNFYGSNNPMPYNNIRIKLPFIFTVMCAIIKIFIFVISIVNTVISMLGNFLSDIGNTAFFEGKVWSWLGIKPWYPFASLYKKATGLSMNVLKDGLCPDLENWYFAPMFKANLWSPPDNVPRGQTKYDLLKQTLNKLRESSADDDKTSIDVQNDENNPDTEPICLTIHTDYLISCVEMNLAMEYKVINFDFYNDWVNGTLYFPRFMRYIRPKKTFLGITFARSKVKGCMDDTKIFSKTRRYTQQCSIGYRPKNVSDRTLYTNVNNPIKNKKSLKAANNLHKQKGLTQKTIFGENGGICHEHTTLKGQYVYYMKPCEWTNETIPNNKKVNLYATDIILLGSLNDCDLNGIPQAFKYLSSTSYIMPTNLALTNMESNGYLYATDRGVMCTGVESLSEEDVKRGAKITIVSPSSGLTGELLSFSKTLDSNYDVQYDGDELSDIIALTEAAGISWNYTGPGQGEEVPEKMYHPGGHFLGLSCVNSQSNIKSCINLSRICEVGANMSQRKEDITNIDTDGKIHYSYTVPSGFISGDDIVGADFRTMFATMNHKRLLATKINPTTGYKMYEMDFIKPINFDGSFNSVVKASDIYNSKIETPKEDKGILNLLGINYGADSRPDYDDDENTNTQTRTIEDTSLDYYLFRFGLSYEEATKTNQKHLRHFLYSDGSNLYLPQYENSYYFYFGLKNGATALDEFNKQFYSECENGILVNEESSINVFNNSINISAATADLIVNTTNLDIPYQYIEVLSDVEFIENEKGEMVKSVLVRDGDSETKYDNWLSSYSFSIPNCPFGTYQVTIVDANTAVYTKTHKINANIGYDCEIFNFNSSSKKDDESLIHRGGYIQISNLKIEELPEDIDLTIFIEDLDGKENSPTNIKNGNTTEVYQLKVDDVGKFNLKVKYNCGDKDIVLLLQTFTIKDTSNLKLYIGIPNTNTEIETAKEMTIETYKYGWWNNMNEDKYWLERVSTFNEEIDRANNSSSIKVYAVGGNKVVWGLPQNNEGFLSNITSNEDNNIKPGYTVDDEYFHYPTLNYNGSEKTHFSAIVYNDNMVMGDYYAVLKDGVVLGDKSVFKNGCGYIFKPVPNGDLEFHVHDDSNSLKYGEGWKEGLFYPSISYPSVDRPFYAKTKFFCWSRRALEKVVNQDNETIISVVDYEEGGRTEMEVYNGISYSGTFFTVSGMSYITNLEKCNFEVPKKDMADIESGRISIFSGYSSDVKFEKVNNINCIFSGSSAITTYGYNIVGGAPDVTSGQNSSVIYDNINSVFADYVYYSINNGQIIGPVPVGGVEGDNRNIKYYLLPQTDDDEDKFIVETGSKYIFMEYSEKVFYIMATYTHLSYNEEGASVVVKAVIKNKINKNKNSVKVSYLKTDSEGVTYQYVSGDEGNENFGTKNNLFEFIFNNHTDIKGVKDYRINYNFKDWRNFLRNKILLNTNDYDSDATYFAIGVASNEENDSQKGFDSNTVLCKIYPTPVFVTELNYDDNSGIIITNSMGEIITEIELLPTDNYTRIIHINCSSTKYWECTVDGEIKWLSISPDDGLGNTAIIIKGDDKKLGNNTSSEAVITFKYVAEEGEESSDEEVKFTVKIDTDISYIYQYEIPVNKDFEKVNGKWEGNFVLTTHEDLIEGDYSVVTPNIGPDTLEFNGYIIQVLDNSKNVIYLDENTSKSLPDIKRVSLLGGETYTVKVIIKGDNSLDAPYFRKGLYDIKKIIM